MDEQNVQSDRPAYPTRRKRSKMQVFKEVYLPVIILALAALLVLIFIIGSIVRAVQKGQVIHQADLAASESLAAAQAEEARQVDALIQQADELAAGYDYAGAMALLDSFTGDATAYPALTSKRDTYMQLKETMVLWDDPNKVVNLSFQLLIADPARAFADKTYGDAFNRNFITVNEFSAMLQQLYDNGYILVRMEDFVTTKTTENGTSYVAKDMYLPSGKKPLMLTQTNVNYNLYLVDSDGDLEADKGGLGFASKLVLDGTHVGTEMVDADGQALAGAFDLVPILDTFISTHPDFSFRGARATLALTGYNGLFGYRTNSAAKEKLGDEAYGIACEKARGVAATLKSNGYTLACYTYNNVPYGDNSLMEIQADINEWNREVVPVIGGVDVMVYAQNSDITKEAKYSGEKFDLLSNAGFNYYLGFCTDGKPWVEFGSNYVRQGRILVTGNALRNNAQWFKGMFDAASVLDSARPSNG